MTTSKRPQQHVFTIEPQDVLKHYRSVSSAS